MFSIFREWWVLWQLKKECRKIDKYLLKSRRTVDEVGYIGKDKFLRDISKNFLWLIPRSKFWQHNRISKDGKRLDRSKKRNPPFVEETTAYDLNIKFTGKYPPEYAVDIDPEELAKKHLQAFKYIPQLIITGHGESFTFFTAFTEVWDKYIKTYWVLIVAIMGAVAGSPYLLLVRDWIKNKLSGR